MRDAESTAQPVAPALVTLYEIAPGLVAEAATKTVEPAVASSAVDGDQARPAEAFEMAKVTSREPAAYAEVSAALARTVHEPAAE